ncbi:S-adenosyl-L-methionine dependent methyltransferase [Mycena galericulata]|nr:S-adenosyl-L-methionine dependent methyltransferase [Mycena galericulata]
MHPRNPYRIAPDFRQLAKAYPPLQPCLISSGGGVSINFKDEVSQRRLTEALLHRDFDISLNLPENRLCPPVSITAVNSLNYVLWIQDLLRTTESLDHERVLGVDIGTGAAAIYPLLSCKLNQDWSFIATDVDEFSLQSARSNVEKNRLLERIQIFETTPEAPIFGCLHNDQDARVDFTMCNPPFYSSHEDVATSADAKESEPNAVHDYPGGESSFVRRMVVESVGLGERCRWYTSMLGKMSSVTEVVGALRAHAIDNYGITEFVQGSTRRWAIVWSFSDLRLPDAVARIPNPQLQSLMPPRNTLRQPFRFAGQAMEGLTEILSGVLVSVDGARVVTSETSDDIDLPALIAYATTNTWSRGARRKNIISPEDQATVQPSAPKLICSLRWIFPERSQVRNTEMFLECQWMQGKDRALFESFSSHVSRKVSSALNPPDA